MAWDKAPWLIGGGAEHTPEVARLLVYAAAAGSEGVVEGTDCRVTALSTPGGAVHVGAGGVVIRNRSAGGGQQSYADRNPAVEQVSIASTGSSARSDLVIVRVEDPQYSPWSVPLNPAKAQYAFTRVIQNVGTDKLSARDVSALATHSALALARIDIPANTNAITQAMIKDIRRVAQPRRERHTVRLTQGSSSTLQTGLNDPLVPWPPDSVTRLLVPTWATRVLLRADLTGVIVKSSATAGYLTIKFGPSSGTKVEVTNTYFNEQVANDSGRQYLIGANGVVPASMRGVVVEFRVWGRRAGGNGFLEANTGTATHLDVEFIEDPA